MESKKHGGSERLKFRFLGDWRFTSAVFRFSGFPGMLSWTEMEPLKVFADAIVRTVVRGKG